MNAMGSLYYWVCGRCLEVTTWAGIALVSVSSLGLTSTNPTVQQCLEILNSYGPTVGAALIAMTERRHREGWKSK